MSGVKTSSPLVPLEYLTRCERAAAAQAFRVERYGEVAGFPLLAFTRRLAGARPRIYLSSGIHGDEPAPPEALLRVLESGALDARATWFLAPMLNPIGFQRRTRENADAIDLNRDYRAMKTAEVRAHIRWLERQPAFDLALCLHEDWEATGFYLYELNPEPLPSLAPCMLAAARARMPIDPAAMIDGRAVAEPGIIRAVDEPGLRELWPEAIYLRAHHTRLVYTLETPSALPLEQRVATLAAATCAALEVFCAGQPAQG